MTSRRISSGGPLEDKGYSRAVAAGPWVLVADTTSTVDSGVTHVGDVFEQTRTAFGIALAALAHPDHLIEVEVTAFRPESG